MFLKLDVLSGDLVVSLEVFSFLRPEKKIMELWRFLMVRLISG
jgi:hypothetical protein